MRTTNKPGPRTFLVNGTKCELTIEGSQAICWWPSGNNSDSNKKKKRIEFRQIIGIKRFSGHQAATNEKGEPPKKYALNNGTGRLGYGSPLRAAKKQRNRIKVYYAKQNKNKTSGQLLKLRKLTIEWHGKSAAGAKLTEDEEHGTTTTKVREASEPPSCYASDGSNSHMSSLSQLTSSSASPVEPQLFSGAISEQHSIQLSELEQLARQLELALEQQRRSQPRPQRLLVFVNPFGGKGRAVQLYKSQVRRLFQMAAVEVKLVITKYANHARDTIEDPAFNVEYYDGIVCVGGDGMFSELMNGLLFRYNREALLKAAAGSVGARESGESTGGVHEQQQHDDDKTNNDEAQLPSDTLNHDRNIRETDEQQQQQLNRLKLALGGIGQQFVSPPVPLGVIGAGSTDANAFGLIGTNDVITAALNIILGHQINIDVCSIHTLARDRLLRFVSTFVGYGYFGDVVRESEKLRWLGPSRYDVTGANTLLRNRSYGGSVRILISSQDPSPKESGRCRAGCSICQLNKAATFDRNQPLIRPSSAASSAASSSDNNLACPSTSSAASSSTSSSSASSSSSSSLATRLENLSFVEKRGPFAGVNAAVTACRCPQTQKGFSPNQHLANGCADLILVHPCSRLQYLQYLLRTAGTKKSAFDLKFVEAFRCRQFEFLAQHDNHHNQDSRHQDDNGSLSSASSSASTTTTTNSIDQSVGGGPPKRKKENRTLSQVADRASGSSGSSSSSSWNADGEILNEQSVRVKVNSQLLRVFGTGEPMGSSSLF